MDLRTNTASEYVIKNSIANNSNTIGYVKVGAVYAHKTLSISNIGISISTSRDITIGFTPSYGISQVGKKKVRIDPGPVVTNLN